MFWKPKMKSFKLKAGQEYQESMKTYITCLYIRSTSKRAQSRLDDKKIAMLSQFWQVSCEVHFSEFEFYELWARPPEQGNWQRGNSWAVSQQVKETSLLICESHLAQRVGITHPIPTPSALLPKKKKALRLGDRRCYWQISCLKSLTHTLAGKSLQCKSKKFNRVEEYVFFNASGISQLWRVDDFFREIPII